MILLNRQTPLTLLLACGAASGLLALLLVLLPSAASLGWFGQSIALHSPPPLIPKFRYASLDTFMAITERPLFNPGHQKDPPPPPPEVAKPQLPPLESYRLAGLVISPNAHLALIEKRGSSQVMTFRPGDNLDGRTIVDIEDKGVTLNGDGALETLTISPYGSLSPGQATTSAVRQ